MNKPNVPTLLLAVLVALVGWQVLVNANTPPAIAGGAAGPTEPHVVQIAPVQDGGATGLTHVYRLWSDGSTDMWAVNPLIVYDGTGEVPTWSDVVGGQPIQPALWFGWVPFGDPVQRADLNADGCVDTPDLLELLAAWTPCP